ncbi:ANTAR domain-containing protein [[Mycobacterium] holstebronense]|uniref:ANTAR domain-containing protein n=1 Tax=[Mycobacterium] holstebronense TaxID=3064288 RepID=A0ABN9NQF4_9MYCO|nr:ANTAR domain-containing protein [Mycolicibacter sp. MU0102]
MPGQDRFDEMARRLGQGRTTGAVLLLDRDLRIRGVNAAYERISLRRRTELLGDFLFDAFPENPSDPKANGRSNLEMSLETAMRTGRPHRMWLQRYDVRDLRTPDKFVPKVWKPWNAPLIDHGVLLGAVHHVEPVTQVQQAVATMERALEDGESWSAAELLRVLSAVSATENAHHHEQRRALVREAEQLQRAIENRDTIGQAKGALMERYDIDATAAFNLLVKISQDTNTPVAHVARKLTRIDHPDRR